MIKTKEEMKEEMEKLDLTHLDPSTRSLYQYELGKEEIKRPIRIIKHLGSFFLAGAFLLYSLIHRKEKPIKVNSVIVSHVLEEVIPESIREEGFLRAPVGYAVTKKDLKFVYEKAFKKAPLKPFFWFNILTKVCYYRYLFRTYDLKQVVTSIEYSFVSSLLTEYCEDHGVSHVNVQHGDKLYSNRDSFFYFHKMYLWDNHYTQLFRELKAQIDRVVIELPAMLRSNGESEPDHDWTYYTQMDNEDSYKRLKPYLKSLKGVHMRVHPRYGNRKKVEEIFELPIENYVDIETSLARTRGVIGVYTTVLYQGYLLGKEVLLDDLSDPHLFSRLKDVDYFLINKECKTLSEYLGVK